MKTIYKYFILALLSVSVISCDLDINENPNYSSTVTPDALIPSGITWSAAFLGSDVQLATAMWAQHYAQNNSSNQYTNFDSYNITNLNFSGSTSPIGASGFWGGTYAGALKDFYVARDKAAQSEEWGYWIPAQVMIAFNYHVLVDFYEKIPFSEAIDDNNPAPKYDEGKAVYTGIISILDAAIAKKDAAKADEKLNLESQDLIFGRTAAEWNKGKNIDNWVKFAKTLKLKILLRDFNANKTAIQALLTEGDLLTSDAKLASFKNEKDNSNPLYENDRRELNTTQNIRGSATMITYLLENSDPRIANYYELATATGTYNGLPQGGYTIAQGVIATSETSRARLAADDPVYFMSAAESYFLQAECYARLNDATNAKTYYDKGVTAAFTRWGHDASTFIAAGGVYEFDSTDLNSMIKSIIIQKWVASVRCQAWDAFFDINRTGYPEIGEHYTVLENNWVTPDASYIPGTLTPSVNSVLGDGKFPRRFLFPKNSTDNNPNAPASIPLDTKMWWHKQ